MTSTLGHARRRRLFSRGETEQDARAFASLAFDAKFARQTAGALLHDRQADMFARAAVACRCHTIAVVLDQHRVAAVAVAIDADAGGMRMAVFADVAQRFLNDVVHLNFLLRREYRFAAFIVEKYRNAGLGAETLRHGLDGGYQSTF